MYSIKKNWPCYCNRCQLISPNARGMQCSCMVLQLWLMHMHVRVARGHTIQPRYRARWHVWRRRMGCHWYSCMSSRVLEASSLAATAGRCAAAA